MERPAPYRTRRFLTLAGSTTRVAERDTRRIAHDLLGEPHVHGRRVSVRQLTALVETRGEDPAVVAERFDLDLADVSHALAYYHGHPDEMRAVGAERETAIAAACDAVERPEGVDPDEA